jgi:TrmH family RNA methyltransferase
VDRISSRQNPLVKRFRDVARGGERDDAVLVDGPHLVTEALNAGVPFEVVAFADQAADSELDGIVRRASSSGVRTVPVSTAVLSAISRVREPAGIVAIARCGPVAIERVLARRPQLVVIVAGVQDPGNVGAIVRAAEACGATGVVTTPGSADAFGWKALRGSMGSAFRMPIARAASADDAIRAAKAAGVRVFATVPHDGTPLPSARLTGPSAVVLGGEGSGLDAEVVAAADERIAVPMQPPVESLNVATAAALIVYEAARQRALAASAHQKGGI